MTKTREKITIEGVMEKEPSNTITLKEVYDGLIEARTLIREMKNRNKKVEQKFTLFIFLVLVVEFINMVFNYVLYARQ